MTLASIAPAIETTNRGTVMSNYMRDNYNFNRNGGKRRRKKTRKKRKRRRKKRKTRRR